MKVSDLLYELKQIDMLSRFADYIDLKDEEVILSDGDFKAYLADKSKETISCKHAIAVALKFLAGRRIIGLTNKIREDGIQLW